MRMSLSWQRAYGALHGADNACLLACFSAMLLKRVCVSLGLAAESSSDSEDEDDEDDDDEVEDSEGGEETCPAGCDSSLYDKVTSPSCLLRICFTCHVEAAELQISCRQELHMIFHGFCLVNIVRSAAHGQVLSLYLI